MKEKRDWIIFFINKSWLLTLLFEREKNQILILKQKNKRSKEKKTIFTGIRYKGGVEWVWKP